MKLSGPFWENWTMNYKIKMLCHLFQPYMVGMSFCVKSTSFGSSRLGLATGFPKYEDVSIQTPSCLLYTRNGYVPLLTPDILDQILHLPQMLYSSIGSLYNFRITPKQHQATRNKAFFYPDLPLLLAQTDPVEKALRNSIDKNSVAVWHRGGRSVLDMQQFCQACVQAAPALWQTPADNETDRSSGAKRCNKAVDRTNAYWERLQLLDECRPLLSSPIPLMSVTGGYSVKSRVASLKSVKGQSCLGVVLDGFRGLNSTALNVDYSEIDRVLSEMELSKSEIPNVIRFLPLVGSPGHVVRAVESHGIDLFDGAFPYILTCASLAWHLHSPGTRQGNLQKDQNWLWNLADPANREDFTPILQECACFACQRHTRAYIHHLFETKEILAKILLQIHNLHCYCDFFHHLRQAIANDRFHEFFDLFKDIEVPEQFRHDISALAVDNF